MHSVVNNNKHCKNKSLDLLGNQILVRVADIYAVVWLASGGGVVRDVVFNVDETAGSVVGRVGAEEVVTAKL